MILVSITISNIWGAKIFSMSVLDISCLGNTALTFPSAVKSATCCGSDLSTHPCFCFWDANDYGIHGVHHIGHVQEYAHLINRIDNELRCG